MITLQYVNDLAVFTAQQHKKNNSFEFSRIAKRILKDDRYRSIFIVEYNNAYASAILPLERTMKHDAHVRSDWLSFFIIIIVVFLFANFEDIFFFIFGLVVEFA